MIINQNKLTNLPKIGPTRAEEIKKVLGNGNEEQAYAIIKNNPYALLSINGIGFKTADHIALTVFNWNPNDANRHRHGNISILVDGSIKLFQYTEARQKLGLHDARHEFAGTILEHDGKIPRVWLPEELHAEKKLSKWFLQHAEDDINFTQELEYKMLDPEQQHATNAVAFSTNKLIAITGTAGSGKTTVIATAICELNKINARIIVLAFAGKAADRAKNALTQHNAIAECSTIHKALGYNGNEFLNDQLGFDVVIVDEMSMVPNRLLHAIIQRLKPDARLILVGDEKQLPPIGHGQPFIDFLNAHIPTITLKTNHRQANARNIFDMALAIRDQHKEMPEFKTGISFKRIQEIKNSIAQHIQTPHDDWQIITYTNETRKLINAYAQEIINPNGEEIFSYKTFAQNPDVPEWMQVRLNDKVAIIQNDYNLGCFNGQIGTIIGMDMVFIGDTDAWCIKIKIGVQIINIPIEYARSYITLAYCITVHKSQGSGWKHIIVAQPKPVGMSGARWWFTAITRAELSVEILTEMPVTQWWADTSSGGFNSQGTLHRRIRGRL